MRLAVEAEWIFWNDGEAISEVPEVRRVVPVRDEERSSLRPSCGTWRATWAPSGPQREPGALRDDRSEGVPLETALGAVASARERAPRAAAVASAAAHEAGGDRRPGAGAAGAGEAPLAEQAMQVHDSEESGSWDFSDSDDESNGEEELAFHLARLAGDEAELAAASRPAPGSPEAMHERY